MPFNDLDSSVPRTGDALTSVEEVTFRCNRDLPGVQLEIIVYKEVDGQREAFIVPDAIVDAGWPGPVKNLKNHLKAVINEAVR